MDEAVDRYGVIADWTLEPRRVRRGDELALTVQVHEAALPVELYVAVDYPNGRWQEIGQHARAGATALRWRVPAYAGVGTASLRVLATRDCPTCGPGLPTERGLVRGCFTVLEGA